MGCCNDGVLRPLLSGSSLSRRSGRSSAHSKNNSRARRFVNNNGNSNKDTNCRRGVNSDDDQNYDEFDFDTDDEDVILGYSGSGGGGYRCRLIGEMLRKVGLLVWKNLLLRRIHYIVTALEVILPTLLAMILAAGKSQGGQASKGIHVDVNETMIFPPRHETDLKLALMYAVACDGCFIGYAPSTSQTDQVMNEVKSKLAGYKIAFKPFESEEEIKRLLVSINFNDTGGRNFQGAVVFENGLEKTGGVVSYKIRLFDKIEDTALLFPWFQVPGPENVKKYETAGFVGLQILLDRAITKVLTGNELNHAISLQAFPYPPFTLTVDFAMFYFLLLPQIFVLGFIFMVPSIVRAVVSEKGTGIRLLKLNGLPGWMQWLGWMVNSLIILTISITIVVFLLFWTFDIEAGAVLVHSDPSVWWIVLFLYVMSASSFCFFISSFFQRPTLATTVGIILWLSSYYFLFVKVEKHYQESSFLEKMAASLLPNMALHLAIKVMSGLEGKAVGAHWYNMAQPISSVDTLSLAHVMLMFLVNTCMYMALTVYVENVFPSEYGVRKPWYYIFQVSTWWKGPGPTKNGPTTLEEEVDSDANVNMPGFEPQPTDSIVGIHIQNLRKRFGRNKIAVAGVNAKMYDGEIFALLGHNGAGKTTTISMLTGLFAPSGGTATVNGHSITSDLDRVRQSLGLCPQHNMLFDKLTVNEHMKFFGQLKGLTAAEANKETRDLLQKLQLSEKASTLSMALSGGQKRKLSLGIALIGGTKVVILDEPTSGMDPEARRAIWDLLLEMRGQRTILLTTHFMEEADVLGDRIGIMASGKLQCCGTPIFLKKFYGTGYTLKMSTSEDAHPNNILTFIQNHVPNASIKFNQAMNSTELLITLPTETASSAVLSEMFSQLSASKGPLGIKSIGLSLTTMDEVFVRVGELAEDHVNGNGVSENGVSSAEGTPETQHRTNDERLTLKSENRTSGLKLAMEQFMALLTKKYVYTLRKRKLMLSQLIIPILILILAIRASNLSFEVPAEPPALRISLDSYRLPVSLYSAAEDPIIAGQLASTIGSSAKLVPSGSSVIDSLIAAGKSDLASYRERNIIALEANSTSINALFNTIPNHAAPLAINLATNALLKSMGAASGFEIQVTNHPMQSRKDALTDAAKPDPIFSQTVPIMFAIFMPIGLALLAASFIVFPIEEKLCKAKQLQLMTGVSPLIYWSSAFVWDFIIVFIVICAMTACFPIFQNFDVFTSYGGAGVAFLILLVYGYSAISFSYLVSVFASTVAGGFAFVSILHIASGILLSIIVHLMEMGDLMTMAANFRWIGRIFPTFGAAISTMRYTEIATKNGRCNILSPEVKKFICDPSTAFSEQYGRECCDNCATIAPSCFKPIPYITWEYEKVFLDSKIEAPGIGQELLFMVIMAVVYQVLLILLEYGVIQHLVSKLMRTDESVFDANINDEDVLKESQRVNNMVTSGDVKEDALVVNNLCKSYGALAAVSKLSFGVHHGECFGLLGVNGAGKTTTFRMLTGDEFRSCGNAYGLLNTLDGNRKRFLSNIGYCPQFDGIIDVLTGQEMLQLFCRLRGVPGRYGIKEAEKWLTKLGLAEAANVQCRKYSGGMKRRLSMAMAMIGDPPLLLLDEPTSGVDPVSRRQFWKVLESLKSQGQSIILTSHSMEECEALCSRLGIMVNGQLQCLGGVQHLKGKFAQGYSLSVKLKPMVPVESEALNTFSAMISEKFSPCTLKDKHQCILQYQVHNTSIPWDIMFQSMEDLKERFSDIIEDYSVNETTLEEVFLSFARMQYGDRKANVSFIRRLITCQC